MPTRFDEGRRIPIPRRDLARRLESLDPADRRQAEVAWNFSAFANEMAKLPQEEILGWRERLLNHFLHPFLEKESNETKERRAVLAALRRRRSGGAPPSELETSSLGVGDHLRHRWEEPTFGLESRFPWLAEAERLSREGRGDEFDRYAAGLTWDWLEHGRREFDVHVSPVNPLLLEFFDRDLELRVVVCALRRRKLGMPAPVMRLLPVAEHIRRRWRHPTFTLSKEFPWLEEADRLLQAGASVELERLLATQEWRWLRKRGEGLHPFSFESLLLYLARWDMLDRWNRRDADVGKHKLSLLVKQTLGTHANLFANAAAR
jgi:hypothetical protein